MTPNSIEELAAPSAARPRASPLVVVGRQDANDAALTGQRADILSGQSRPADRSTERVSSELRAVAVPRVPDRSRSSTKSGSGATFLAVAWPTCSLR
jgi:hypothetical protein